ncbi:hypothetical protein HDU97_009613, partial [Phlyctochytrium planicorne]
VKAVLAKAQAAGAGPGNGGQSLAQLTANNGFAQIQNFNGKAVVDNKGADNNKNNNNKGNDNKNNNNNNNGNGKGGAAGNGDKVAEAKKLLQQAIDLLS